MEAGALAEGLGLELFGDPTREIERLAPIDAAGAGELSFVTGKRQLAALKASQAALLIVPPALAAQCPVDRLESDDPYGSYAAASWLLRPETPAVSGMHPTAVVEHGTTIDPSASIGAHVSIGARCRIAADVRIGAGCRLGNDVHVARGTRLFGNVVLEDDVRLGADCRVQSGVVIGGEGFGYAPGSQGWRAIHQIGGVRIGERVHIGAATTIDCGAIDPTVIGDGVILDNQIQIAHNVRIGENTAIAACTGIAGSAVIGRDCLIGGACNINGHITVVDGVTVTATSFVQRSIREPGSYGAALPLQPSAAWHRTFAALGRLDELVRKVRRLERRAASEPGNS